MSKIGGAGYCEVFSLVLLLVRGLTKRVKSQKILDES